MASNPLPTFKIVLVGDGTVGKTTFVRSYIDGQDERKYVPTLGAEVYSITLATNKGNILFNVWDTAGQEKLSGLRDGYYVGAQGAIIMFDVGARTTYKNVPTWYRDVDHIAGSIPMVLVANKVDLKEQEVKAKHIRFHRKRLMQYFGMSAKGNWNVELPFLWLARRLMNDQSLEFVGSPVKQTDGTVDQEWIEKYKKEREDAEKAALEFDDDDL